MHTISLLALFITATISEDLKGPRPNCSCDEFGDELDIFSTVTNIAEALQGDDTLTPNTLTNIVNIKVIKDRNLTTNFESQFENNQPLVAPFGCRIEKINWIIFSITVLSLVLNIFSTLIMLGIYRVLPESLRCYFPATQPSLHPSSRETRI